MTPPGANWRLPLCVAIGYLGHLVLSARLEAFGARPHIGLTVLAVACLFAGPNLAAFLGFGLGLLESWAVNQYVGSYLVSRSVAGFCVGAMDQRIFRDSVPMAVAAGAVTTLFADVLFFVFVPQPESIRWLTRTLGSALYDGGLAIPIYFAVRRVVHPVRPV
jgi:cell shape-determining protein MreD